MKKMKYKDKIVHRGQNSTVQWKGLEGKNGKKCSKDKQLKSCLVESNLTRESRHVDKHRFNGLQGYKQMNWGSKMVWREGSLVCQDSPTTQIDDFSDRMPGRKGDFCLSLSSHLWPGLISQILVKSSQLGASDIRAPDSWDPLWHYTPQGRAIGHILESHSEACKVLVQSTLSINASRCNKERPSWLAKYPK